MTNIRPKISHRRARKVTSEVKPTEMKPIGILGGGQLARMMVLKAHELGLKAAVLSKDKNDPAAQVTSLWTEGDPDRRSDLKKFLRRCSLVTFESEFLDAEMLAGLERETRTRVSPDPSVMALLQDRLTQKQLLVKYGIPTAPFRAVQTPDEARWALPALGDKGAVFKKRRFGYDGYGTFVVRSGRALESFICDELRSSPHGFIAESFVSFRREVAVMAARSAKGQIVFLPFVESYQSDSRCLWVKGPLPRSPRLSRLTGKIAKFLNAIDYRGAIGIELFDTGGELVVNELAPRVHNSGHYSLDALTEDQFTLHIKAILGQDLATPKQLAPGFAMMNLLGSSNRKPKWRLESNVKLHWYGKSQNRLGRKMGHINAIAKTPDLALAILKRQRESFEV